MSEVPFQFSILRYIHDPVTEEFINIGIVVYSREAKDIRAKVMSRYGRLSSTFLSIDGNYYRRVAGHIERQLNSYKTSFKQMNLYESLPATIEVILSQVLPPDDSSLVFSQAGAGLSTDLEETLERLYIRLVGKYIEKDKRESRNEQEVWQVFSSHLDKKMITPKLESVSIKTDTYEYQFTHAWKNERWHPLEPVSFDLVKKGSILEKANRWIGRAMILDASKKIETLYLLIGAPSDPRLDEAYKHAMINMERNIQLPLELVEEDKAALFSENFAALMEKH